MSNLERTALVGEAADFEDEAMYDLGSDFWARVLENAYKAEEDAAFRHMAALRQRRIRVASDRVKQGATEGTGMPEMHLDPVIYHAWARRFRDPKTGWYDYSCWQDKEFVREFIRDNEEVRIRVERPGNRVGWTPAVAGGMTKREGQSPKAGAYSTGLILTDRRGNAA